MGELIKLGTVVENSTGKYMSLVALEHWRGSRALKRKFDTREEAQEYLRIFEQKYYGMYRRKYYKRSKNG